MVVSQRPQTAKITLVSQPSSSRAPLELHEEEPYSQRFKHFRDRGGRWEDLGIGVAKVYKFHSLGKVQLPVVSGGYDRACVQLLRRGHPAMLRSGAAQ